LEHEEIKILGKELAKLCKTLEAREVRWLELAERA